MSVLYEKEKVIGSGTYGNVWLIRSKVNNFRYVLKEVNLASLNTSERQEALTEVAILSKCKHVNIVRYKDSMIDHNNGMLSIIMEYADGGDLYSAIVKQRGVPFKEHTVIMWFVQMCLALQYIHNKNILHRDLKTRNIFLTRDGKVKVGDFGIARCLARSTDLATTAIGTPYYLSPEICQRKPYNYKSDIWALGCILFEMAALAHPFHACNFQQLLSLILTGQRKELPKHCSLIIQELVDLLLDENPETRPSTDEILGMPSMQPYLSELWVAQSTRDSTPLSQMLTQTVDIRRHSIAGSLKSRIIEPTPRRASISSADSRLEKRRLASVSKVTDMSKSITRSCSFKGQRNSIACDANKMDYNNLTYKIFRPPTYKKIERSSVSNYSENKQKDTPLKCEKFVRRLQSHQHSDYGYQSEESLKVFSSKIDSLKSRDFSFRTSTKKCTDSPDLHSEEISEKDVFVTNSRKIKGDAKYDKTTQSNVHYHCQHSQCQQCMIDMLWKNRIRMQVSHPSHNEKTEIIQKLHRVFGENLFHTVYQALFSQWEGNDSDFIPATLKHVTDSLNFSQLQHLPLIMQLIQLDLLSK